MHTRKPVRRFIFGLFIAVQLLLPAAAGWADAREIVGSKTGWFGVVHLESERTDGGARHDADTCVLCQFATHIATVGGFARFHVVASESSLSELQFAALAQSCVHLALPLPRAPPVS